MHGDAGTTPLHLAAYAGDLELARLLVSWGPTPVRRPSSVPSVGWAEHAAHPEWRTIFAQRCSPAQTSRPTRSS